MLSVQFLPMNASLPATRTSGLNAPNGRADVSGVAGINPGRQKLLINRFRRGTHRTARENR